jgi:site-specific DNA recombinase
VSAVVIERLSRPDARDLLHDQNRPDVEALRTEANALQARLDELAELHVDGDITKAQLRAGTERARVRLAAVETELISAGRVNVLGPLLDSNEEVGAVWAHLDTDRRRAVVDTLMVVRVLPPGRGTRTFRPETVEIAWRTE